MLRYLAIVLYILFAVPAISQNRVQMLVRHLPAAHDTSGNIYVAGSFNGWNPKDPGYLFQKDREGNYRIEIKLADGKYEYKITKGGWDKVESKKDGGTTANRILEVNRDTTIELNIEEWADRLPAKPQVSTASKNVRVIDTAFLIPGLNRTRRVWIYLPECYHSCTKRFPVLYMHDGQNLFDDITSFSGEWGVDEYLDSLGMEASHCIVVAVDHGGVHRLNEYSPFDFELKGIAASNKSNKGEGKQYVDFLVKTLKPYIDRHYRTAKNKANTAIAGSSMGGLISLYAVLEYPRVFGAAGVFSPAFWVAPQIFDAIQAKGKKVRSKIYFYAGKLEGEMMVPDMLKAYEAMSRISGAKMQAVIRDDGRHSEASWRKEFPLFYEWINKDAKDFK